MAIKVVKSAPISRLRQPSISVDGTFSRGRKKANSQAWTKAIIIGENANGRGFHCRSNMSDNNAIALLTKAIYKVLQQACDGE